MLRSGSGGARRTDAEQTLMSLRRLNAAALAGLGRQELLCALGDIERLVNRLAGYRVEVLNALNAADPSDAAPDAHPRSSLRDATGVSGRDAGQMIRIADKVRSDQGVLTALNNGDITTAQAETLCDARVPDAVRDELLAAAGAQDTDQTREHVRRAEAEHSTETPIERFERQQQMRGAGWRRDSEGMLKLWARFDPNTGAQIEALLGPLCREMWRHDKSMRSGRRTPAQRDADALAYALTGITATDADTDAVNRLHARARRNDEPRSRRTTPRNTKPDNATHPTPTPDNATSPKPTPDHHHDNAGSTNRDPDNTDARTSPGLDGHCDLAPRLPGAQISILIDLDALRGRTDQMGLTDAGIELPPELVRAHACDAQIIPIILNGPGGPADIGHAQRTVPRRLRRLLIARDRHCRWPGCHQPPSRCDAHHIIHWLNNGPTNLDNLVLLCHHHHHHLHQHGYRMIPQPDGNWTTTQQREPEPTTQRTTHQPRGP